MRKVKVRFTCPHCQAEDYIMTSSMEGETLTRCDPEEGGCDGRVILTWRVRQIADVTVEVPAPSKP